MTEPITPLIAFLAIIFAIPIAMYLLSVLTERADSLAQFPPISDAEFLAKCKPGTNPGIALKVRAIVADQLCIEESRIYPEHRFVEDLRAD